MQNNRFNKLLKVTEFLRELYWSWNTLEILTHERQQRLVDASC